MTIKKCRLLTSGTFLLQQNIQKGARPKKDIFIAYKNTPVQ